MNARDVALAFLERVNNRDVEGVLALAAPGATVDLLPLRLKGRMETEGRRYLEALAHAFPDLNVTVRRLFAGCDGTAIAEVTIEGVQAADFLGIVNQEKHMDLDQIWFLHVRNGRIHHARAYWCQNRLYRRLGVRRLDTVTITT